MAKRMYRLMSYAGIYSLRFLLGLLLFFINANELFSFARVFAKAIVGDPIKPGGKLRFAAKSPDVFVGANKCLLRQVVGHRNVAAGELAQQTTHARLMTTDQLAISVLVVINKNSSDKAGIG